jgi:5'-methylthioadenosine phosphorylase
MVMSNLQKNIGNAKKIISKLIQELSPKHECSCGQALKFAIVTDRKLIPLKVKRNLNIIIGKYVK